MISTSTSIDKVRVTPVNYINKVKIIFASFTIIDCEEWVIFKLLVSKRKEKSKVVLR